MLRRLGRFGLRFLKGLAWVVGVAILLLGALYLLRKPVLSRPLADLVARKLSPALRGQIRLPGVEGNYYSDLVLVGLSTRRPPPRGALVGISFDRARVDYDLWGLLHGGGLAAVDSVHVQNIDLRLDTTRPAAPGTASKTSLHDTLQSLPRPLPELAVDGSVTVHLPAGTARAGSVRIQGKGRSLHVLLEDLVLPGPKPVRAPRYEATVERTGPDTVVWTSTDSLGGVTLKRLAATLPATGSWHLAADAALASGEVKLDATPARAQVDANHLDFGALPDSLRALLPPSVELPRQGRARLRAEAREWRSGSPDLEANLSVEGLVYRDFHASSIRVDGAWRDGKGSLRTAEVEAPEAHVEARDLVVDTRLPYLLGTVERLDVDVPDLAALVKALPFVRTEPRLPEKRVSVAVHASRDAAGTIQVRTARFQAGDSFAELKGAAYLPDRPSDWKKTRLSLSLDAELKKVETLFASTEQPPRYAGSLVVKGAVRGVLDHPSAGVTISGSDVRVSGRPIRKLEVEATLLWPVAELKTLTLETSGAAISAHGTVDLRARSAHDVAFSADVPDLSSLARIVPGLPEMAGTIRAEGTIAHGSLAGTVRGSLRAHGTNLELGGTVLSSLDVDVDAADHTISVKKVAGAGPWGQLTLKDALATVETLSRGTATVKELSGSYRGKQLALKRPLVASWSPEAKAVRDLDVSLLGGEVSGEASLTGAKRELRLDLQAEGLSLHDLVRHFHGRIGFRLQASGDPDRPRAKLTLQARELSHRGYKGTMELEAHQDEAGLEVDALKLDAGASGEIHGNGTLPFSFGLGGIRRSAAAKPEFLLEGSLPDFAKAVPQSVSEQLSLTGGRLSVHAGPGGLTALVECRDLTYRPPAARTGPRELQVKPLFLAGTSSFHLNAGAKGLHLSVSVGNGDPLSLRVGANSPLAVDWTDPRSALRGFRSASLSGTLSGNLPKLEAMEKLLPLFVYARGSAKAELTLGGTVGDPRVDGEVSISASGLKLAGDTPPFQDLEARLKVSGRKLTIERFDASLGYAPMHVSGTCAFPVGSAPAFDLKLEGKNALLARAPNVRARADIDVTLKGPLDRLAAAGTCKVTQVLYTEPMNLLSLTRGGGGSSGPGVQLFSIRSGPFASMRFDLDIAADRTIRIQNNMINGVLDAHLHLGGTGSVPEPEGRVEFQDVRVSLDFSRLLVQRGELSFPPGEPFSPRINVEATSRMQGYDLSVQVTGTVPDVQVYVSAVPPLPEEDALLLLATGSTRQQYQQNFAGTAIGKVGSYVGSRVLSSITGPANPDAENLFDRLTVVVGRDVSEAGNPTIEAEFQLSQHWYLVGERDKYEDYNAGVAWRLVFR